MKKKTFLSVNMFFTSFFFSLKFRAKKRILRFDNQKQSTSESDAKQQSGPYKRVGGGSGAGSNIHRLSDTKDSDDENNTWNGNSTQQQ